MMMRRRRRRRKNLFDRWCGNGSVFKDCSKIGM
jgi:hypothetical protein